MRNSNWMLQRMAARFEIESPHLPALGLPSQTPPPPDATISATPVEAASHQGPTRGRKGPDDGTAPSKSRGSALAAAHGTLRGETPAHRREPLALKPGHGSDTGPALA